MKIANFIKDFFCALLFPWGIIFAIAGVVILCAYAIDFVSDHECVVIETRYFHSTEDKDKCKFIAQAKERNYTIKRMSEDKAREEGYKICKVCFSQKEQESYYKLSAIQKEFANYTKWIENHKRENLGWDFLWAKTNSLTNEDFSKLYVYIDNKGKLHISTYCMELAQDNTARKIKFDDVVEINTTCELCVGREYVDFIYKKIDKGIYDVSLIGSP